MNSSIDVGRPQAGAVVGVRARLPVVMLSCVTVLLGSALLATPAQADSVTRVYQSRMADGSVVFGDRPEAGAAHSRAQDYRLPDAPSAAALEAERASWAAQSRAFEQRYTDRLAIRAMQEREAQLDRLLRAAAGGTQVNNHVTAMGGYAHPPLLPLPRVGDGVYRSSPGAVNGRGAPFLSSGFVAHPVVVR
ncbi:MAG: hypothetical protein Q4E06_06600 [Lautropia sp.]|nr:hypothetical protein [Lautropia sp.]